jgi:superfamily II DNA helicase RecQ
MFADPLAGRRYSQLLGYALDTTRCRRAGLLGFLGQESASCSGCDVCDRRIRSRADGEDQILDFVLRNRRRFTLHQATQILHGARSYEVVRRGLAGYYGFGLLPAWQEKEIEEALEMLRRSGKIRVLKRGFWKDRITSGRVVPG